MNPSPPLRLTVLGSGTCELRPEASSPAHLVSCGHTHLLMDLGQGALSSLMRTGLAPAQLDAVLITHHHPDHLADLIPLLFALNYDPGLRTAADLTIHAHQDMAPVLAGLSQSFGHWLTPQHPNARFNWLQPGDSFALGPVIVRTAVAEHIATSLAYRLETSGASLAYLGDSQATDELASFCQGVDLLLVNCAATDQNPKPGHLGPTAAGRLAADAHAGALVLSHLYSYVDSSAACRTARSAFGGPVWLAADHQSFLIQDRSVTCQVMEGD